MATDIQTLLRDFNPARLIPAEKASERQTVSIFLASLRILPAYSRAIFGRIGHKMGSRVKIETYTEPMFKDLSDKEERPDGLIVIDTGHKKWSALVEAKISKNILEEEQLMKYLDIAKKNNIDALITISNQLVPNPEFSPVNFSDKRRGSSNVAVYHWSWKYLKTEAQLLQMQEKTISMKKKLAVDNEKTEILRELLRFFKDEDSGIQGFNDMGRKWESTVKAAAREGKLPNNDATKDVVERWIQEEKDLSLLLSEKTGKRVQPVMKGIKKYDELIENRLNRLLKEEKLTSEISLDTTTTIIVKVDLSKKTVYYSIDIPAPSEGTAYSRLKWLLDQIPPAEGKNTEKSEHIRITCKMKRKEKSEKLEDFRQEAKSFSKEFGDGVPSLFTVAFNRDLEGKVFSKPRQFIKELESDFEFFYDAVVEPLISKNG